MTREQALSEVVGILADKIIDADETRLITDAAGVPGRILGQSSAGARWNAVIQYAEGSESRLQSLITAVAKDHPATAAQAARALTSATPRAGAPELALPVIRPLRFVTDAGSTIFVRGDQPREVELWLGNTDGTAPPRVEIQDPRGGTDAARPIGSSPDGEWWILRYTVQARGWRSRTLRARVSEDNGATATARVVHKTFAVTAALAFAIVGVACIGTYVMVFKNWPDYGWSLALGLIPLAGILLGLVGLEPRPLLTAWLQVPERALVAMVLLFAALWLPGIVFSRVENRTGKTIQVLGRDLPDHQWVALTVDQIEEARAQYCVTPPQRAGWFGHIVPLGSVTATALSWSPLASGDDLARAVRPDDASAARNDHGVLVFTSSCAPKLTSAAVDVDQLTLHIPYPWTASHGHQHFALTPPASVVERTFDVLTTPSGPVRCTVPGAIEIDPIGISTQEPVVIRSGDVVTKISSGWYCHPTASQTVRFETAGVELDAKVRSDALLVSGRSGSDLPRGNHQLADGKVVLAVAASGSAVAYAPRDVLGSELALKSGSEQWTVTITQAEIRAKKVEVTSQYCVLFRDQQLRCPGAKPPNNAGCTKTSKKKVKDCENLTLYQCPSNPC